MNVNYSDKAKQSAEVYDLLQQATNILNEVIGPAADLVTVEWDRQEDDKGRSLYTLQISDWKGAAATSFAPDELASSRHLRVRLYHLWGQLLQTRTEKLLQELSKGEE